MRIQVADDTHDGWRNATMIDDLSTQITAVHEELRPDGGTVEVLRFYFKRDENVTWRTL